MKENYHNKLTNTASLMTKSAIVYILLILFAIIFAALLVTTAKADIQITDPQPGNRLTDFDIIVSINNSLNVSDTQAMIAGFDWMPMTQLTQNGKVSEWTTRAKISDYPAGTATITARYREQGKAWIFVTKTRTININKTDPATIKASVTFTVLDYFNNPIADVMVQPTGNKTDTTGIVTVAGLSLSQTSFTFTKNGYNTTTINMTLTGSQSQTVILRKDGDTLKTFSVSGLSTVVTKDTVSYIKVKDATTKEYVSGATVTMFIGSQVKSMPGETTGGRVTVGYNEPGDFDLLIEKDGYKDYSETIKVIAPTVTPTPVPPVILPPPPPPIPEKRFRADVGANITDDEYRIWLTVQEQKAAQQNANNTSNQSSTSPPISSPPSSSPPYTTYALLGIVGLVSVTTYISKKKKNGQQPQDDASIDSTDYRLTGTGEGAPKPPETITLTCTQCPWTKEVPKEFESSIESVQANHAKLHEV